MEDTDTSDVLLMARQKDPREKVLQVYQEELRQFEEQELARKDEEVARKQGVDVSVIRKMRIQLENESKNAYDTDLEDKEEDDEPDEEDETHKLKMRLQKLYDSACRKFHQVPVGQFRVQVASLVVKLASLSLTGTELKPIAITLSQNRNLTTLDLSRNCLSVRGLQVLFELLTSMPSLTDLNVSDNKFGTPGATLMKRQVRSLNNLRKFNLSDNDFEEMDADLVAILMQECSNLRSLLISGNNFSGRGGSIIGASLATNNTLENLRLSWNNIRGQGMRDLVKALQTNDNLGKLDLGWNGLSDDGAKVLSDALLVNVSLTSLDISYNRIGILGAMSLAKSLQKNEILEELKLHGNSISSQGIQALVMAIKSNPNSKLRKLEAKNCSMTYDTAAALERTDTESPMVRCNSFVRVHDKCSQLPIPPSPTAANSKGASTSDTRALITVYLHSNDVRLDKKAIEYFKFMGRPPEDEIDRHDLKRILNRIPIPTTEEKINKLVDELEANENDKFFVKDLKRLFPPTQCYIEVEYSQH